MKYVVIELDGKEYIFLFPREINHNQFHEVLDHIRFGSEQNWKRKFRDSELVSAGFVNASNVCYGKSETLKLDSRPELDTELLKKTLNENY